MEAKLCVGGGVKEWSLGDLGNLQDYVTHEIVGDVLFVSVLKLVWCCVVMWPCCHSLLHHQAWACIYKCFGLHPSSTANFWGGV